MLKKVCRGVAGLALATVLSQGALAQNALAQTAPTQAPQAATSAASAATRPLILAQRGPDRDGRPDRNDRGFRDDRRPPPPRFDRDYRHRGPPPGWRRYHDRPRDWRRRGCLLIGPIWYCP